MVRESMEAKRSDVILRSSESGSMHEVAARRVRKTREAQKGFSPSSTSATHRTTGTIMSPRMMT